MLGAGFCLALPVPGEPSVEMVHLQEISREDLSVRAALRRCFEECLKIGPDKS